MWCDIKEGDQNLSNPMDVRCVVVVFSFLQGALWEPPV